MDRTSNSIKNVITALIVNIVNIGISFFTQKLFINFMGLEYLGLNGIFSNILTLLSIAELGIGEAIVFHLYKPIAENNKIKIKGLLLFYKRAYNYIAVFIFIVGVCLIPFIDNFVGETSLTNINLKIVFFLFLLKTISSYILTYKRSILYASQKNYIINIIHLFYIVFYNSMQMIILFVSRNYYLYLASSILAQLIENALINLYVNKNYMYLKDKNKTNIDKKTEKDIFRRLRATFLHKIGAFIVNGTDNILISKLDSVATVGLYSNYYMIISAVTSLFSQIIYSTTASIGNLLTEGNREKNIEVFRKIRFLNFYIAVFTASCIITIIQDFIKIWLGEQYLLDIIAVIVLTINYYQKMMRRTHDSFLNAAGICVENRFVPLIESCLNIIFSILLYYIIGLPGIFMGTIISGFALWMYSYPRFVYKGILKQSYKKFAIETFGFFMLFALISSVSFGISVLIKTNIGIINVIIDAIIAIIIPNLLMFIIYHSSNEYQYFLILIKTMINKIMNKRKAKNVKEELL